MHVRARESAEPFWMMMVSRVPISQASPALFVNGRGGTCGGPTRAFQLRCVPKPPPGFESPHTPDSRAVSGCLRTGNPNDATPSLLPCSRTKIILQTKALPVSSVERTRGRGGRPSQTDQDMEFIGRVMSQAPWYTQRIKAISQQKARRQESYGLGCRRRPSHAILASAVVYSIAKWWHHCLL